MLPLASLLALILVAAPPPARSRPLASGFTEPVAIAHAPGDTSRVFVCERAGLIRAVDTQTGVVAAAPYLDLRPIVSTVGDGGLLGLAFAPDFATTGRLYVNYNAPPGPQRVLTRYTAVPGAPTADPASAAVLWSYPRPVGHNGGWIGFSPVDGFLYLSSGDGGTGFSFDAPNRAQTIANMPMGKMHRLDVSGPDDFPADPLRNYRIPSGNPFVGVAGDDEIWAYGLRQPWRCSFDRLTGDLYIADVGQDLFEEIDAEPASTISPGGRNYGWRCAEANACTSLGGCDCPGPGLAAPLFVYDHTLGNSVTGGYVYRGPAIPALQGLYFFADYGFNTLWTFRPSPGLTGVTEFIDRTLELTPPGTALPIARVSAFGEDAAGELYLCDVEGGHLYKIVPNPCPADLNNSAGLSVQDIFDFLGAYFAGEPAGDFNGMSGATVQDIFDFLAAYFAGCA